MSEQEIAIIIQSLRKAIEWDKNYFVKAKIDMSFDSIRSDVNALLEEILQETKVKAEQAIIKAEGALKDAEDSQAKVYALQEYGAAKAKLVLATDKFDSKVYNSLLEAKPIATAAYDIAIAAKEVALDVRQKVNEIEEERKTEKQTIENFEKPPKTSRYVPKVYREWGGKRGKSKSSIEDALRKNLNRIDMGRTFSFLGLIFIIMSIIKWDFVFYLWGAFFGGIGVVFGGVTWKDDIIEHISDFIFGFILAPLWVTMGVLSWLGVRSDEYKEHTKQLKELNENYRQKLDIHCDLGNGLKRGETVSVEDWLDRGRSYAEAKSFDTAISCFDSALALYPENDEVWVSKGNSLEKLGRNNEAMACCDRALKLNSENFKAWINKGVCLDKLNRIEEALRCCDKALDINPNFALTWSNKGLGLRELSRADEALICFDKALEINPGFIRAWINKGRSLEDLGKFGEAVSCYDKALKINPGDERAREFKEACLQKF
jgi:tetratricopeptide (TPR) repeat protein